MLHARKCISHNRQGTGLVKIKRIHVKNFRSIKDQEVSCDNQTIFIGSNGTGKSTILKALQAFFDLTFKPTVDDYFAHDPQKPIEITVVFTGLNETETKDFSSHIHNGEMSVTRAFGGENSEDGNFQGLIKGCKDFEAARSATKADDKKREYKRLQNDGYSDLPHATTKDAIDSALAEWERENPDKCHLVKDGGQFLGFKSVGGGKTSTGNKFYND